MTGQGRYARTNIDLSSHELELRAEQQLRHRKYPSLAISRTDINQLLSYAVSIRLVDTAGASDMASAILVAYRETQSFRDARHCTPTIMAFRQIHDLDIASVRRAAELIDAALHDQPEFAGSALQRILDVIIDVIPAKTSAPPKANPVLSFRRREPRVLNKHVDGIPAGAVYCGRGSYWANPFRIGDDGTRDEVCDLFERRILPGLDISALRGRDLVCFCAPKRCHCDSLLAKANAP